MKVVTHSLRMDNPLAVVPRRSAPGLSELLHRSGAHLKSDQLPAGITDHFASESVITFGRNDRSLCAGMGDHFGPESAVSRPNSTTAAPLP